jgi:hypothetical protein
MATKEYLKAALARTIKQEEALNQTPPERIDMEYYRNLAKLHLVHMRICRQIVEINAEIMGIKEEFPQAKKPKQRGSNEIASLRKQYIEEIKAKQRVNDEK